MIGIALQNLSKKMGKTPALKAITTQISPGYLHGLIGPEGAGKTTLLRLLAGLLKPDNGTIQFTKNGANETFSILRPDIAYMPEQQSLYPDLSVKEHLDFFRELYELPKSIYEQRAQELLHLTRLTKFQELEAGKLSGGMYKKLGLMCALLRSPKLLLLDEPTNGVDPVSRREFWELLYRLREKQITILISTAYLEEAERCMEVKLLQDGELLAAGEPRALLTAKGVASLHELYLLSTNESDKKLDPTSTSTITPS